MHDHCVAKLVMIVSVECEIDSLFVRNVVE